jgi:hypothetical protein
MKKSSPTHHWYHFPLLSITILSSTTCNNKRSYYCTCTHSIHILYMLQVKHVGPSEEDLHQEKWKVLSLICRWTIFHCPTQLKHTMLQNGLFECNGTMESSISNVLVNCFPLCCSSQRHHFKMVCSGAMENSGVNVGGCVRVRRRRGGLGK